MVKQDNNGTTFVISDIELPGLANAVERCTRTDRRPIGAWTHPASTDIPMFLQPTYPNFPADSDPPF